MSLILSFGQVVIQQALTQVKQEKLDRIYCSATGVQYGQLSDSEIVACLAQELARKPLSDSTQLVDDFIVRHVALSSGLAPSLRYHKDHHTMVRSLTGDPLGANRLLGYLIGRLFFDTMVREKDVDGYMIRRAKLHFLIEFQDKLAGLMPSWHQSLTEDDEALSPHQNTTDALQAAFQVSPDVLQESKAAQRSLESLLRLDAIYNLRSKFYDLSLKNRLLAYRDANEISFTILAGLLDDLESNAIIRLSTHKLTEDHNSMIISSALEALSWSTKRIVKLRSKFEDAEERGRIKPGSSGQHILDSISAILADAEVSRKFSKDETRRLDTVVNQLSRNLESVSWSDKRLDSLNRVFSRQSEARGTVKVIKGVQTLKHLVDSYKLNGHKVPAELEARLEQAIKAGLVSKAEPKNGGSAKPKSTKIVIDSNSALGSMMAKMATQFGKKD